MEAKINKKIKLLIGIARGALPRCPTTIPRRPQEAPRRPKTPQGRPKGGPGRANTPQDAPKTAPRRSRRLQKVSKIIQKSMFYNCEPSAASERAQRAERAIQEASRWIHDRKITSKGCHSELLKRTALPVPCQIRFMLEAFGSQKVWFS